MIPWAVRFQSLGLLGLVEMLVFIAILLVGLLVRVEEGGVRMGLSGDRWGALRARAPRTQERSYLDIMGGARCMRAVKGTQQSPSWEIGEKR